ncbi:VOC family protein [Salaquimonas pukyongi]|uniref:VOC family protein n=1 Tax=Salaquimonas pukyongi TaxID=2712698 RepID=UPI00096BBB68|nr:VOC family protein [Salaquimonas pukyongi]
MAVSPRKARSVDHLVLPVAGLELARQRLGQLGFSVAPDAIHPFGTENACVFFEDGTYLEPLAIYKREICETQALKGNVFVARDQAFRFRRGDEGFSAFVLATKDADGDHKLFRKLGISGGRKLTFSRIFESASGKKSTASFKLAFAADLRSPDSFVFTCERVKAPPAKRGKLAEHENGAIGISELALGEPNPSDFQYFLQEVLNQRDVNAHSFGIELEAANANVAVYTAKGLGAWYGIESGCHGRGLRFRAFSVAVKDLGQTEKLLRKNKVACRRIAQRVVVDHAPGQGCVIAFEEAAK